MATQMPFMQETPQALPEVTLIQMITARWVSQAIAVAARLGIADLLGDGPQSCAELAAKAGAHTGSLYRLLRALSSVGIFAEDVAEDGTEAGQARFRLTPLAEPLCANTPGSLRGVAIMFGEPWSVQPWGDLLRSVQTGETAFDRAFGIGAFDYFSQHPHAGKIFEQSMNGFTALSADAVLAAYDFSAFRTLVDVAGGHGILLAAILRNYPSLQGILFDAPQVVAGSRKVLEAAGLADRCVSVGGDFFASLPQGGDAYLMKNIIHDWDSERCIAILRNCRRAVAANGKLLIVDAVIEPGNAPAFGKLMDLEMLVMTQGGRERTAAEFRTLLDAAGFHLTRIVPTPSPFSIVEGAPA